MQDELTVLVPCRREEEKQERLQRALEVQEAEWIRHGGEEAAQEEEEEESIPDDFYCPVCDKSFKSDKALANHERCVAATELDVEATSARHLLINLQVLSDAWAVV